MTSIIAAGVTIPAAMGLATRVEAQTPQSGGTLKYGMAAGSTTDSLDPATYENDFSVMTGFSYGNALTEVGPDGILRAELAESFEPRESGAVWAFKLRPGVEFHNGKSLTPEDVIASINYHRGENSTSAAKGILNPVVDITKEGEDTVVFTLDGPNADFPYVVSDYHLLILPSENGEIDPTAGIGTGGYIIENYEPGVRLISSKNPNYFKEGAAHFDGIELLSIIDVTARQNALMSGEVNAAERLDPKTVALVARNPAIEILEKTGYLHYTFPMRLDTPPFDNFDLRMALKLAINRDELVEKVLLGHGAVGNDHPISPAVPFHAEGLNQRTYDPDEARSYYEKSGHSGPIQLSTSDAAFAGAVDAAQLIQASAAAAGIEIEVVREPADGYWSNVWNKKGWCACYWSGRPTQDWMYTSAYTDDTEWNDTAWRNTEAADRFNELVVAARSELDEAKRAEMYFETQQLIHEDGGAIVPMFANYIMGLGEGLAHGEEVAANWANDGNKATERWWFES
ncbi:ABC transporter substrate-binding protein [Wenxinia marina]|nr:ABC transporter substrate-binding protein [Wenxinia marina]